MRAEHAPEERLVAPNLWATLSVHVVASPGSHAALEVAVLSVRSLPYLTLPSEGVDAGAIWCTNQAYKKAREGK